MTPGVSKVLTGSGLISRANIDKDGGIPLEGDFPI